MTPQYDTHGGCAFDTSCTPSFECSLRHQKGVPIPVTSHTATSTISVLLPIRQRRHWIPFRSPSSPQPPSRWLPQAPALRCLPNELLLKIIGYLDRADICRLVNVNSLFRGLVRGSVATDWAYEHGTTVSARGGLYFPVALNPYHFTEDLDLEAIEDGTFSPDEEAVGVAQQVRRIDIKPHASDDCADFVNCEVGSLVVNPPPAYRLHLDLLHIQLHFPQQESREEPRMWFHTDPAEDEEPEDHEECFYLVSLLEDHDVQRVVMKDIPRAVFPTPGTRLWYGEFVAVLFSHPTVPSLTGGDKCQYNHGLGFHMLDMVGLAWAQEMVIVFWTERPGQSWLPPCIHVDDSRAFWAQLALAAFGIGVHCLTVVNAGAVLTIPRPQGTHERLLRQHAKSGYALLQDIAFSAFDHVAQVQDNSDDTQYRFLTMQDWIREGDWEDVFTPAQIEPWLDIEREE